MWIVKYQEMIKKGSKRGQKGVNLALLSKSGSKNGPVFGPKTGSKTRKIVDTRVSGMVFQKIVTRESQK